MSKMTIICIFFTLETLDLKEAYSITFPLLQLNSKTTSVKAPLRKTTGLALLEYTHSC